MRTSTGLVVIEPVRIVAGHHRRNRRPRNAVTVTELKHDGNEGVMSGWPTAAHAVLSSASSVTDSDERHHYRAIWLSDIHLGTPGCQAYYLLEFLRVHRTDTLYLVGDILDGWRLRKGWYWPQAHNDVVQKILRAARKGTRVVYVPGNHDALSRQFIGLSFGGIEVLEDAVHTTARGVRLWVTHGDLFDAVMLHAKWLAHLGSWLYELLLDVNRWMNAVRLRLGMPYWSMSQYVKHQVKNAVSFISTFEQTMAEEARRRGCDGVVCGHIHKAEMRDIDGVLYCNDGDWVESMTALVETVDGELRLIHWRTRANEPLNLGRVDEVHAEAA